MRKILLALIIANTYLASGCTQKPITTENRTNITAFEHTSNLTRSVAEDVEDKNCSQNFSRNLAAAKSSEDRALIAKIEAKTIYDNAQMITGADWKGEDFCGFSGMLGSQTAELSKQAKCFKNTVGKFYNLQKIQQDQSYKQISNTLLQRLEAAETVLKYHVPLSTKNSPNAQNCNTTYLRSFYAEPLRSVYPLSAWFSH